MTINGVVFSQYIQARTRYSHGHHAQRCCCHGRGADYLPACVASAAPCIHHLCLSLFPALWGLSRPFSGPSVPSLFLLVQQLCISPFVSLPPFDCLTSRWLLDGGRPPTPFPPQSFIHPLPWLSFPFPTCSVLTLNLPSIGLGLTAAVAELASIDHRKSSWKQETDRGIRNEREREEIKQRWGLVPNHLPFWVLCPWVNGLWRLKVPWKVVRWLSASSVWWMWSF